MKLNFQKKIRIPRRTFTQFLKDLLPQKKQTLRRLLKQHEPGLTELNPCTILDTPYRIIPKTSLFAKFFLGND